MEKYMEDENLILKNRKGAANDKKDAKIS